MESVYEKARDFKNKYPGTIAFRLNKHAKVIEDNLLEGEKVIHVYCGLNYQNETIIVAVTDKRVIVGHKNIFFGSFCYSIDKSKICEVYASQGVMWGYVRMSTLTDTFVRLYYLDLSSPSKIKEEVIKSTVLETINEREKNKDTRTKTPKKYTSKIEEQKRMCKELDRLYKEKYRVSQSEEEKQELKSKIWSNYYYYKSLTESDTQEEEKSQSLILKRD